MKHNYAFTLRLLPLFILAFAQIPAFSQCGNFYDGFESGVFGTPWLTGTGTYARTIMNTGAPVGNYYLNNACTGSNSFYQGTYATWTPAQPTYFSFWMRTNTTTTVANGYVVIGNSAIASDNGILFCYFNTTNSLRFFNTTGYNHPVVANTWYHVEARNVNWTSRTMDIWVNNALILSSWAFRSTTAMDADRVHMFSLGASSPDYDDVRIGLPSVTIDSFQTISPICFGDSSGAINISPSTPNGSMTYVWSNGASTQDLMALNAGSYTVTVTDSLGCTTSGTYSLTGPTQIVATATTIDPICPGGNSGAIDLTASGGTPGYTYLWSNGATTEDLTGLAGGSYVVDIADTNGCSSTDTIMVNEPAPFTSSGVLTSPSCFGGSDGAIDFSISGANGGYSYLWTTGDLVQDVSGLIAGTYSVFVTDSLGCNYQDSFQVANPAPIVGNATVLQPTCFGLGNGSISLNPSGGSPTYSYAWSTGASASSINASAGTYMVTITDLNGCTTVDSILVSEPAQIALSGSTTDDTGSGNGGVDLTVAGGTPGFTYAWSNGATTQDLSNVASGSYTVTVTDNNGCTSTSTFVVDLVIGIADQNGFTLQAWPNPFHDQFTISLTGMGAETVELKLMDMTGRLLWKHVVLQDGQVQVNENLANGVYYLNIRQGASLQTVKMIQQ